MKINVVCVGKIKEKFFTDAIDEYKKRLSRFAMVKEIEVDEDSKENNLQKKSEVEGNLLLSKCSGVVIAMDMRGKMFSSPEIAEFIKQKKNLGQSEITFVIGGSNGLSSEVIKRADLVLSFGNITYPHQLFRVVLFEQIYRAITILEGLPYHK